MNLSERLKALRKQSGMTLKQLGEQLHLAENTLSQYERGVRTPDVDTLLKMADFYSISVDELIRENDLSTLSVEDIIKDYTEEIKQVVLLSGRIHLDTQKVVGKGISTSKIIEEIVNDFNKLTLVELLLIRYLVKSIGHKDKIKVTDQEAVEKAYQDGLAKGKSLRIKELKQMREI